MSMHKAVLVRSAHRAMYAQHQAEEEEAEVEDVVMSPEKDLGEDGEADAEGEDEQEFTVPINDVESEQPKSGGVIQAGVSLLSSFKSFVRKSMSPERKSPVEADLSTGNGGEDGEILENAQYSPLVFEAAESVMASTTPTETEGPAHPIASEDQVQRGSKSILAMPPVRSPAKFGVPNFAPSFKAWGVAKPMPQEIKTEEPIPMDVDEEPVVTEPLRRQDVSSIVTLSS